MLQCADSCFSSDGRRAGCRLHCSDHRHRLVTTKRGKRKKGSILFVKKKTQQNTPYGAEVAQLPEVMSNNHSCSICSGNRQDATASCGLLPELCAPCQAPCLPLPATHPRSAAPSASRSSGADTLLSAVRAQTQASALTFPKARR